MCCEIRGLNNAISSSAFGLYGDCGFQPHGTCERFYSRCRDRNLLADYSRPLFLAAGLNPNTVGIALINNKSLNAFVANGQNIYFHTGLILESEDPNMVIGVIAHEIGHIIGGHLSRKASAINEAQRPALVATILGLGSVLAGAPDVGLALITGGQHVVQRKFLSFNRAQESSADVIALRLLEDTGQSPNGIIRMMDMLADQEILSEVSQDPYVRSHPLSRERVASFTRGAELSAYRDVEDTAEMRHRHKMAQAKIRGFLTTRRPRCAAIPAIIRICPHAMPVPLLCTDRASLVPL